MRFMIERAMWVCVPRAVEDVFFAAILQLNWTQIFSKTVTRRHERLKSAAEIPGVIHEQEIHPCNVHDCEIGHNTVAHLSGDRQSTTFH